MSDFPERVLLLADELSFRGASILALRLAQGLHQRDIDTVLLCTRIANIDRQLLSGLSVHEMPGLTRPVWGRVVRRTVLKNLVDEPPDVIHLLSPDLLPQAIWLGQQLERPVVISIQDHTDASRIRLGASAGCVRVLVCVSESVRQALPENRQLNHVEQRVILPGVPVPGQGTEPVLADDRDPVVGMAGPLEVLKGGSFFLRACHRVLNEGINVRIVIAGSGPEERNLRKLATSLQLDSRVTFVDDSADMLTFITAMDIFCLPSLQQGIGVLLLEAMALGRPVIASGVGGIMSVLDNSHAGITVPASDSRQLAEAMLSLLQDPQLARGMAQSGQTMITQRFSHHRMIDDIIALYGEVAGPATATLPLPGLETSQDRS